VAHFNKSLYIVEEMENLLVAVWLEITSAGSVITEQLKEKKIKMTAYAKMKTYIETLDQHAI